MTRAHGSHPRPRRRILRTALVVVSVLALLAVGGWAYVTRAQGQAQAVQFADARLSPAMTGARVLALGEATHGNAEFQQMRTTLLSKTVDHGFRTVVLEEDYGSTHEVDAFIQGGPGSAQEAAKKFGFTINKTAEVAHWLQWMRDHNASVAADQRIRLVGMDVQRTEASLRIVADALAETDPQAAERARTTGDSLDRDTLAALQAAVEALPAGKRHDAEVALTALGHGLDLDEAGDAYATVRDRVMFSHLRRIVEETDGGVVLIAHDGHVAKAPTGVLTETVGRQAAAEWGEKYRVIGTDFHRTTFLSGQGNDRGEWSLTNRTPLRGMYAGTRVGYLEVAQTQGENRALFDAVQPMGSAGEAFTWLQRIVPFFHTVHVVPSQLYDAVVLVDDARPVTML